MLLLFRSHRNDAQQRPSKERTFEDLHCSLRKCAPANYKSFGGGGGPRPPRPPPSSERCAGCAPRRAPREANDSWPRQGLMGTPVGIPHESVICQEHKIQLLAAFTMWQLSRISQVSFFEAQNAHIARNCSITN